MIWADSYMIQNEVLQAHLIRNEKGRVDQ